MMKFESEFINFYKNKKVLLTGHTGFKGSWMSLWLSQLGAKVYGISDKDLKKPNLFSKISIKNLKQDIRADLTNLETNKIYLNRIKPDIIFHFAAQPIVLDAIKNPVNTIYSNSITTINLLESLRNYKKKTICIFVTTDKVYENVNRNKGYIESDKLGGKDIYSASKSMAELGINSYFNSFFINKTNIKIAVGRPCNCIGGGDWSPNRLIPDLIRSWGNKKKLIIRSPKSIRPWQHVLEPLGGYLMLALKLSKNIKINGQAFNFGPNPRNNIEVIEVVKKLKKYWKFNNYQIQEKKFDIEEKLLKINNNKSKIYLNWSPLLDIDETLKKTSNWYLEYSNNKKDITSMCLKDINDFQNKALRKWS